MFETNGEELTPQSITPIDVREYKRYLLEDRGFKPATVNRRLASISAFCKWGEQQGLANGNPCDEISIVPEVRTAPKWLTKGEQYGLIRAVQRANRRRDEALIMVMLHTGLRVGEVSNLRIGDISISARKGEVIVRGGKGKKFRLRHTFGKNLVDAGVSLDRVAALLGHENLNRTRIYTTASLADLQHAVERIGTR